MRTKMRAKRIQPTRKTSICFSLVRIHWTSHTNAKNVVAEKRNKKQRSVVAKEILLVVDANVKLATKVRSTLIGMY